MTTIAPVARRLHEVAGDLLAFEELMLENGGEWSPAAEELLAEMHGNLESKVDGYAALISEWLSDAARWRAEEERVSAHRRARENAAQRLKDRLCEELQRCGQLRVATRRFTVAVQRSAPSVELLVSADLLPARYQRVVTTIRADRLAMAGALAGGGCLTLADGTVAARLTEGTSFVRIR